MFANRMREQIEAAKKIEREHEETKLKTRHLNTRLELKQGFFEKSQKAIDSPEKQKRSPAKQLVAQDEVERKRFLSGDGEASFFYKSNPRRTLSSDACLHDTASKKGLEETTRRHSSPDLASRR